MASARRKRAQKWRRVTWLGAASQGVSGGDRRRRGWGWVVVGAGEGGGSGESPARLAPNLCGDGGSREHHPRHRVVFPRLQMGGM